MTVLIDKNININRALDSSIKQLKERGYVVSGDKLVFVVGIPMDKREAVNTVHI